MRLCTSYFLESGSILNRNRWISMVYIVYISKNRSILHHGPWSIKTNAFPWESYSAHRSPFSTLGSNSCFCVVHVTFALSSSATWALRWAISLGLGCTRQITEYLRGKGFHPFCIWNLLRYKQNWKGLPILRINGNWFDHNYYNWMIVESFTPSFSANASSSASRCRSLSSCRSASEAYIWRFASWCFTYCTQTCWSPSMDFDFALYFADSMYYAPTNTSVNIVENILKTWLTTDRCASGSNFACVCWDSCLLMSRRRSKSTSECTRISTSWHPLSRFLLHIPP